MRKRDLASWEKAMEDEMANFARITELYEDLVAQLERELSACG
jgi:Mlc titration factor MtfA (ptsG expression regulator)